MVDLSSHPNKYPITLNAGVFETAKEISELQNLLDSSFASSAGIRYAGFNESHRLTARQLAGFRGYKMVAVATVNSMSEPRVAPRWAAFLHGKFYLAANSGSTTVRRLSLRPMVGITYYEHEMLIMGHGTAAPIRKGGAAFAKSIKRWSKAFSGGEHSLEEVDLLIRVDCSHLVAFALHRENYPQAWDSSEAAGPRDASAR